MQHFAQPGPTFVPTVHLFKDVAEKHVIFANQVFTIISRSSSIWRNFKTNISIEYLSSYHFFAGVITIISAHTYKKLQHLGDENHTFVFMNEVRIVQA